MIGTVVDNKDGTYSLSLSVTLSGKLPLFVEMNGSPIGDSPYNMTFNAGMYSFHSLYTTIWFGSFCLFCCYGVTATGALYVDKCFVSGSGTVSGTLLTPQTFTITSYDRLGNARTLGDDVFTVLLIDLTTNTNISIPVEYQQSNIYKVTFVPTSSR
jgi:hypothetical protein